MTTMSEIPTSASLIARVRDRADSESWREFYRFYQPLLLRYLRKLTLKEHDANDVIQDVFIRLLKSLPTFELYSRPGRFRTYLWKLTHSAMIDHARRLKSHRRAEEAWVKRFQACDETESQQLWKDLEGLNRKQILEWTLNRLKSVTSPITWRCFEQRVIVNRPASAIAAELGITPNAVYVNTSHVMKKVRNECRALAEKLGEEIVDHLPG